MTTTYNLRARTNCTFRLTRDLSQVASVYNVPAAIIRMQARVTAASGSVVYGWASDGSEQGGVSFDAATGLCVFSAPQADMATMQPSLVYDARLELPGGVRVPLFVGRMSFTAGVTRTTADTSAAGAGLTGDTVTVDGEASSLPGTVPVSLTAAIAAAQAAAAQAEAIMTPVTLTLDLSTPGDALLDF